VSFEFALPADSGWLFVGSVPLWGGRWEIYVNGRPRGSTPQYFKLPVGEYRVQVKEGDVASSPEVRRIVPHGDTAWFMYDFTGDSVAVE
ncbi:MAG TPA: PEGA domain-containing protein, partial [candidate division Zixibacteria bacterium]|nr:PEGA domain-containing protein [candidate division Zixibacteria bacterium]